MAQNVTQRFPFSNKGVVQKIDINQLQDGQYSLLLNTVSEQEGSLSPRYGHTNLTGTWPSATPAYATALHVTQIGATSTPTFFLSEGTNLYRKIGTSGNYTQIASNISVSNKRVGMATYKTDQTESAGMTYIATAYNDYPGGAYTRGMLRNNNSSATAKYWGILPPAKPAAITPSTMVIKDILTTGSSGSINLANNRATNSISSATEEPTGSKFWKIVFSGSISSQWLPGMYIVDGTAQSSVIEKIDKNGAIYAYFPNQPVTSITSKETASLTSPTPGLPYSVASSAFSPTVDLSFGLQNDEEGYVSDDTVSLSFYTQYPERIFDIRFRLYVSNDDYYEKAISPGDIQSLQNASISNSTINPDNPETASELWNYGRAIESNDYPIPTGVKINYDTTQAGLSPAYLTPSKTGVGGWSQVEISKRSFVPVGKAGSVLEGSGSLSWANVTKIEVLVRPVTTTDVVEFKLGSIFAYGGKGVNSNYSAKLTPYRYVYTYKNGVTGAESNPSIEMIPENGLNLVRQGINVNMLGADETDTQSFSSEVNKIHIYRAGGTFADGFYRRVGIVDNIDGAAVNFVDTADDLSIIGAPIAEFDNDAPVTSDIGNEYKARVSGSITKGTLATVTLTGISYPSGGSLRSILTPGTVVNIGGASSLTSATNSTGKQESCIVLSVGTASFTTYTQYDHVNDELVIWDTNAGTACDTICSAFNRMWVAGDPKNPHILYSSKTGRPESFPVINEITGNPHVLAVSSPDNPINGIAEFNGEIVCLCQNGIYTVRLDNGRLVGPFKTPANRGLVLKHAWGYVDNEIWFLSNDGIYAWGGGSVRKVTFAIDFIFNNKKVNDIAYFDRANATYYPLCNIQQKNNEVFFNYINSDGWFFILRYNMLFDRWSLDEVYDPTQLQYPNGESTRNGINLRPAAITAMAAEKASGKLYAAKTIGTGSWATPTFQMSLIDYDNVSVYTDNGESIYYEANTKFYDMGAALVKKNFTDIGFEFTSGTATDANNTFFYKVYYDYSTTAGDSSSSIPYTQSRQIVEFPLQQTGSPLTSAGKEARAAMFSLYGRSKAYNTFHNFAFTFIPLSDVIKGRVTDWDDLGHPFDKRLFNVTVEYDNNNTNLVLLLDTITGINSATTTLGSQTITLPAKVGRAKSSIPITADIIAKMVRLRPQVATTDYQIFNYSFQKEDYPRDIVNNTDWSDLGYPYEKRLYQLYINCDTNSQNVSVAIEADGTVLQTVTVNGSATNRMQTIPVNKDLIGKLIRLKVSGAIPAGGKFQLFDFKFDYEKLPQPTILSTPWTDFGYDYLKYAEQISFDVNTNGQNVPVGIYCDGVLKQTVTVNGTQQNRNFNCTLDPGITFQTMRLEIGTIPVNGRFQLWEYRPTFRPADKGPVYHTFDWDNLDHPYDKKISEVSIEFETTTADVRIAIDTLSGIDGNTRTTPFQTLTLPNTSGNRGFKTFPINETICKMVRVRALGQLSDNKLLPTFKMWGYKFGNTVPYPPDIQRFSEWTDLDYPCDKIFRGVGLTIDTGGVNCTVNLEVDGVMQETFTVNTTSSTRQVFLTAQDGVEIIGKLYRLTFTPGNGGKAQVFGVPQFNTVKDSCPFVFLDSYEQGLGSAGYSVLKQFWADYKCAGSIIIKFYNEENVLFYSKTLGPHASRDVERFYLPAKNGNVINKSKKHRITIEAVDPTKPFKWYRDTSRLEYINLSSDQRQGYFQFIPWTNMQLPV
jgi:hypothetical protein